MHTSGWVRATGCAALLSCAGVAVADHTADHQDAERQAALLALAREDRRLELTQESRSAARASRDDPDRDLTPEEVDVLTALDAALAGQRRALDAQLNALTQTSDPTARQTLQSAIDAIQHDIAELTTLRDELQAPAPPLPPAAEAAATAQRQLEQRERTIETIHDDRPPPDP